MCFFLYVVYELLVGLAAATAQEQDPVIKGKIQQAQVWTVVSWCTYPVVYLFPMVGLGGCRSVTWLHIRSMPPNLPRPSRRIKFYVLNHQGLVWSSKKV